MIVSLLWSASGLALAFAMFCRLRLTDHSTVKQVRYSLVAVFSSGLAFAIAPWVWHEYMQWVAASVVVATCLMQLAMSVQWAGDKMPESLKGE
jgi:hypothetical protein